MTVGIGSASPASRPEFAVVGGGLVGWSIAYGLARQGRRVVVHDEGDIALRAARGNFGQVWVQDKGAGVPEYHRLTRESAVRWSDLARGLRDASGIDAGLQQPGGFSFCFDAAAFEARARLMRRMQTEAGDFGFEFEMLDRGSLDRRLSGGPALGPKTARASMPPGRAPTAHSRPPRRPRRREDRRSAHGQWMSWHVPPTPYATSPPCWACV